MHVETAAELLTGLVHELNQPLTALAMLISSAQEVAQTADAGSTRITELLSKIEVQAVRSSEITRRLRQINRRSEPRRSRCDPNLIVKQALAQLSVEVRTARVDVRLNLDPAVRDAVLLDAAQTRQVVAKLLRNAVESLEQSSSLEQCAPEGRIVEASTTLREDGSLLIAIDDNGLGVPPEIESCLFEPFVTSKPDRLGLGLAVSRSIVEAHGGRLWLERSPLGGARFCALFPLRRPEEHINGN
jgi:C4-dicarboxylate-specific signal transduction histidine kinase